MWTWHGLQSSLWAVTHAIGSKEAVAPVPPSLHLAVKNSSSCEHHSSEEHDDDMPLSVATYSLSPVIWSLVVDPWWSAQCRLSPYALYILSPSVVEVYGMVGGLYLKSSEWLCASPLTVHLLWYFVLAKKTWGKLLKRGQPLPAFLNKPKCSLRTSNIQQIQEKKIFKCFQFLYNFKIMLSTSACFFPVIMRNNQIETSICRTHRNRTSI